MFTIFRSAGVILLAIWLQFVSAAQPAVAQPTIEQVNQALDIAERAASHGMTDLSMAAIRRALSFGPPTISTVKPEPPQRFGVRVDTSRSAPLTAKQIIDARIPDTIFRLVDQWGKSASAVAIFETLQEIVLPTARPSEAFLYANPIEVNPLQPDRLPRVNGAADLLIEWAEKAGKTSELQQQFKEQPELNSIAENLIGLLSSLELQDSDACEAFNSTITQQFAKGTNRSTAELTASVAIRYYRDGRFPVIAANLLELSGRAIQQIDSSNRRMASSGPAIILAAARCWFSTGNAPRGVKLLKEYLEAAPNTVSDGNALRRQTDVVGTELFGRGLVKEAREILGEKVVEAFERRYQLFDSAKPSVSPSLNTATSGREFAIVPASAIQSRSQVSKQIWVCRLDVKAEKSSLLFTLPDFQHADSITVAPDGTSVAFDATFPGEAITSGGQIYVAMLDGSNIKRIAKGRAPSYSPKGKRIAYSAFQPTRGVWIMRSTGEDARLIDRLGWNGKWSPNGRMLAYTKLQNGVWDFVVYDIVENEYFSAMQNERGKFTRIGANFTWSPDSSALLFKASRSRDPNDTNSELVTLPVLFDGMQTVARIKYGLNDSISWSSQGIVSAVVKTSRTEPEQLFTFTPPTDGTHIETSNLSIAAGQFGDRRNISASWTPDGNTLIYISKPIRK